MTKTKSTKRALLLSALSLLMCVSMLVGSTFAWFTDSATSGNNKIVAGTLDVDLLMGTATDTYTSIADKDAAIFGANSLVAQNNPADTLWEPGKTQIVYLAVANKGNLDLKYNIALNVVDGGLIGSLEYAIVDGAKYGEISETSWTALKARSDAQTGDVVAGTTVAAPNGAITVAEEIEYFALAVHMKEEAGNKYQGKDITIDITVLATQLASESDSFDNQYDANANVYTASTTEDAQALIYSVDDGAIIQLTAGDYGKLMLQSAYVGEARTIKNLTIKGADGVNVAGIEVGNKTTLNNVVIDSINFTGEYDGFKCNVGDAAVDGLTINKCTMTDDGTAQFVSIKTPSPKNVKITNCTVDGAQRLITMVPSNNVTITGNTMKNLTVHGILLDNSGGRYHTGTIVIADNEYDRGAGECFIRIANLDATNTLIIKDNTVTNYMAGTNETPYEDTYIKITTANGEIDIMGNTATDASALGGPVRGNLYVSVNGEEYAQPVPRP